MPVRDSQFEVLGNHAWQRFHHCIAPERSDVGLLNAGLQRGRHGNSQFKDNIWAE